MTPSWQPDPFGRHELRFRDSERWTEHVADRGIPGIDTGPVERPARVGRSESGGGHNPSLSDHSAPSILPALGNAPATVFDAQVLMVESEPSDATLEQAVRGEDGRQVATLFVGRDRLAARLARLLTTSQRREVNRLRVIDSQGSQVLSLTRPLHFAKPTIVVRAADGTKLGQLIPEKLLTGLRYGLYSAGQRVGSVGGKTPTDNEVRAWDAAGSLVARVSTTWEVLSASQHPTNGTYLIIFEQRQSGPLDLLVLGALLALDTMLLAGRDRKASSGVVGASQPTWNQHASVRQ